jgi:hypothetical protein
MPETAETLIAYAQENSRVCPQPMQWNEFWNLLPERKQIGGVWHPSLPLILAAWWEATNLDKMLRLAEHIRWAEEHGAIEVVSQFLRGLPESDWHHLGD